MDQNSEDRLAKKVSWVVLLMKVIEIRAIRVSFGGKGLGFRV